ncbi:hypothetical protein B0A49_02325 [Cryomyces minteri]|uniref:PHD-type domain-containing protein n=1 Tax=Cryomyces minteri TaxID=331657 RepID=A0A4U0XHT5_9PEZI|nr:hypothetical protein B0A49_02325 [Cryomyces minteri]
MSLRLAELLNPATPPPSTMHEAADALASLATSSAPPSPPDAVHGFQAYDQYARRPSYGPGATPVEPTAPLERTEQTFSPTLEQYHAGYKSPEERRRQSVISGSPPPILAPIHAHPYGHDTSHILSRQSAEVAGQQSSGDRPDDRDREPSYVRDTPTTTQIRQPSPVNAFSKTATESQALGPSMSTAESANSPVPQIKPEPSSTPRAGSPDQMRRNSAYIPTVEASTLKAVKDLKNEHGLRAPSPLREASTPVSTMAAEMSKPPTKKRAAPKHTKRGTASTVKKPPAKKRKTEIDETNNGGSPSVEGRRGSTTPSLSRASQTPRVKSGGGGGSGRVKTSASGTPMGSSPAPPSIAAASSPPSQNDEDDGGDGEDGEVYCICRRGDNGIWMIACDGGCDDWFHGKCVGVKEEDGDLIDKYVCPSCTDKGMGRTNWKAMCRRDGCRRPARPPKSKYCSDDCGMLFFKNTLNSLKRKNGEQTTPPRKSRKKGHASHADHEADVTVKDDESVDLGPRGGIIRTKEVKTLATASATIDDFRRLGEGVLSPPATVSPETAPFSDKDSANPPPADHDEFALTDTDEAALAAITARKHALRTRHALLKDRQRFLALAKDQAARVAEREGVKPKDLCGFDPRLSWSEAEFARWRDGRAGKAAFGLGTLDLDPATDADVDNTENNGSDEEAKTGTEGASAGHGRGPRNGSTDTDVDAVILVDADDRDGINKPPDLCTKKRCARHADWRELAQKEARFELTLVADEMRRAEREERDIQERAMVKWRSGRSGGEGKRVGEEEEEEAGVEVVG